MSSQVSRRACGVGAAVLLAGLSASGFYPGDALAADSARTPRPGPEIQQELKSFSQMASVLMIAAHPDDENTRLITYLAHGREYRMAYLSLTRGDGGQNVLGGEFGAELGLIRTHELLAARALDGGRQYFTRAMDFGFSKNPEETLRIWDRQQVLADVVRVIRTFRPDVIVTRFSPTGTNTHGHHTASAILGVEAFKLSGDPKSFPEQVATLGVWQAKRILLNGGLPGPARGAGGAPATGSLRIDAGGNDPVLNTSFADIAGQSRAMHKSQGFGNVGGGGGRGGPSSQFFSLLDGEPATSDIMDGIDTTWARVPRGGAEIAGLVTDAMAKFDMKDPAASLPALLAIKAKLAAVPAMSPGDQILGEKRALLDRIIADCLGLTVQTTVPNAEAVPGETLKLHSTAMVRANFPVKWLSTDFANMATNRWSVPIDMQANQTAIRDDSVMLPANTPVSQPYWLREEPTAGMFSVEDASLIGRPVNPPVLPLEHDFEVGGQMIMIPDEPVQILANAPAAQVRRPLEVIAPVSLAFPFEVRLFAPGAAKRVEVEVTANRANASGILKLSGPADWKITPELSAFKLASAGDHVTMAFTVMPPAKTEGAILAASATVDGATYSTSLKEISYPHLPVLLLQSPAHLKVLAADVVTRGKNIGYLPGAGDSVAESLTEMGYNVTPLTGGDLTSEKLKGFDAVVIGVRAFNTRDDLAGGLQNLFAYAQVGGTVVEQYNRPDQLKNTTLAPFDLHLSGQRVTDETAKVAFLAPEHPVLNTPNKITDADFDNWVQERSIYLPDRWGEAFTPILGMADPGETPPNSALLVAKYGKGYFVYTSLVFFRELPAANPGAFRLFANLVSLGK